MNRHLAEVKIKNNIEPFCSNPECALHGCFDPIANQHREIRLKDEKEIVRLITRKQYVGFSGKKIVWFCSTCAEEIEKYKVSKKSKSIDSYLI